MRSIVGGANWHQHSDASLLDGFSTCAQICDRAKELGFKYVTLSDHGVVTNHIELYDAARERGLIPVLGSELYHKDPKYDNKKPKGFHITLWALNETGLHNLWAISSNTYYATGDGHRHPNAAWEHFEGLGEGVACTSACLASALDTAAKNDDEEMALYFAERYSAIFEDFYIELHTNSMDEQRQVNLWLARFARKHGYKTIYAVDAHYALKEDGEMHDVWLGCQTKAFFDEDHWKMDHEYYIQGEDEVVRRLSYLGDEEVRKCLDGSDELLGKVEEFELDSGRKIPNFPLPEGFSNSGELLKYEVARGLLTKVGGCEILPNEPGDAPGQIRYKVVDREAYSRIPLYAKQLFEDEMPLVLDNGLSDYFLIVADYCRWAKERMLVGPARGSCAASILCYLIDITEIDPLGKGLIFSRFLSNARVKGSMPDVDSDFEQARKGMVHEYLVEKYGADKVTAVGTVLTFGIKLAVKEVCRYYRVPIKDANRLTSIIDDLEEMAVDGDWKACIKDLDDDDRDFVNGYLAQFPDMFAKAERMVGLARSYGKHAAGYVVSPEPLAKILPVRKSSNDEIISQFDKNIVERLGFLKADVLGLRNLTTFRLAAETIKERHGVDIDFYRLKEDPNDTAVWDIFKRGKNLSIFQMDGNGITAVGMELQPHSIDELSTIVALYRPGVIHAKMPDGTGMLEEYIARAHGEKPVVYLHPMLEPILKDTYAVLVFQEQVMRIFTDLAGFTDEEADNIRAAIGKKKIDKMEKAKPHYLRGCAENGIDHATALQIWDQIEVSSSYLFNKAHSLSYATITFWSAWLKAHYFVEYYTACMSTVSFDKAVSYMQEARRAGVEIVPPVLSSLSADYSVISDKEIAFGLENVKGVGHQAVASILENAPYETFEDFVDRSGVNRSVVEVMIRAGVFREVYPNRRDLLERYRCGDFRDNLFGAALDLENRVGEETPDYTPEELMEVETELLGMPLTVDPFEPYRAKLGTWAAMMETLDEAAMAGFNTPHLFLVRVDGVKLHQTKRGPMAFVSFQTDGGEPFECTVFSDMWQTSQQFVKVGSYLRIEVMKTQYKGGASYVLNRVQPL